MESLSFVHQFEKLRDKLDVTEEPGVLPNVLWVARTGVRVSEESSSEDGDYPAYDIRLGRFFITFLRNQIATLDSLDKSLRTRQLQRELEIGWGDTFVLHPHEMVLGVTFESLTVASNCTVQVLSRSSLGRLGLLSATAVQVQPGFRGCLTLELVNLSSVPLNLCPGQRIAQIVPYAACGKPQEYKGHYQDADWKPRFSSAANDWDSEILSSIQGG